MKNSDIKISYGLVGKKVGYIGNSAASMYVPYIKNAEGFAYEKGSDAVRELTAGKVDAILLEKSIADIYVDENNQLVEAEKSFRQDSFVIAVAPDRQDLYDEISERLETMEENGMLKKIESKYIVAE